MLLGPAYLRDSFVAAFAEPLRAKNWVIRPVRTEDAALVAEFFNADDHYHQRSRDWYSDINPDYTADYVAETVLPHIGSYEGQEQFFLGFFNADETSLVANGNFFSVGKQKFPHLAIEIAPAFADIKNVEEVYMAVLNHATRHGIVTSPLPRQRECLRASFYKAVKTDRLIIRPYRRGDELKIESFLNADRASSEKILHYTDWEAFSKKGRLYDWMEQNGLETDKYVLGIFKKNDRKLIGELAFWQDEFSRARMSYYIMPAHRGKGYASEAHKAGLAWSDSVLPDPIRYAMFVPGNLGSRAVLEKSGFHFTENAICQSPGLEGVVMTAAERTMTLKP